MEISIHMSNTSFIVMLIAVVAIVAIVADAIRRR